MSDRRKRAVVVGASVAGLLAGRVLADFFDEVILIDKGRLRESAAPRKAVPQGHHVHVLMTPAYRTLQALVPGLIEDMASGDAPAFDAGDGARVLIFGKSLASGRTNQPIIASTRPFFEHHLRRRVADCKNLQVLPGHRFARWTTNGNRSRVTGVTTTSGDGTHQIPADIVVDARGRGSNLATELSRMGYKPPAADLVGISLGYTSRLYRLTRNEPDWRVLFVPACPPAQPRGAVIARVEGKNWIVTQFGYFGANPPAHEEGFHRFARTLGIPDVADFLLSAEPVSTFQTLGLRECRISRFESLSCFPERLLALGDTVCSLNPVYAQGISKAAKEATFLSESLSAHLDATSSLDGYSDMFRKTLPKVAAGWAWLLTAGVDLVFPEAIGDRRLADRMMVRYMKRLMLHATRDLEARRRIFDATMLLQPPETLLAPRMLMRAMGI